MSTTTTTRYRDTPVETKHLLSALWVTMMIVFAYGDIFSLYRADVIKAALDGEMAGTGLTINQTFLTGTLLYIALPSLMVGLSLMLRPRANRVLKIAVSVVYTLTIAGSCIGESWTYYLIGSAVEVALLILIARTAWTWPHAHVRDRQQPLSV